MIDKLRIWWLSRCLYGSHRKQASEALAKQESPAAVRALVKALVRPPGRVYRFGGSEDPLDLSFEPETEDIETALISCASVSLPFLIEFFDARQTLDTLARERILNVIDRIGNATAIPVLADCLGEPIENLKFLRRVLEVLQKFGWQPINAKQRAAVAVLTNDPVLAAVVAAEDTAAVIPYLLHFDEHVVELAAKAIASSKTAQAFGAIMHALNPWENNNLFRVRKLLLSALGVLKDPRAVPFLLAELKQYGGGSLETEAAFDALAEIGDPAALDGAIEAFVSNISRGAAAEAIVALAGGCYNARIAEICLNQSAEWFIRADSATILGRIGDRRAEVVLKAAAKDENTAIREAASRALKSLRAKE